MVRGRNNRSSGGLGIGLGALGGSGVSSVGVDLSCIVLFSACFSRSFFVF